MVTGKPSMISKIRRKSARCSGNSWSSAERRSFSLSARIICRMARIRLSSKNMCSVRQSPTPSAPNRRAISQSSGVSALVRIFRRRCLSAHAITVAKSPESLGWIVGSSPRNTSPVEPSIVMNAPSSSRWPPISATRATGSILRLALPATHGRPIPRATTAAWLVMPPRAVRMPVATCMPWMSSGDVSCLTRMTFSPNSAHRAAVSASNTTPPEAAPGEAGKPFPSSTRGAFGSSEG